MSECKTPVKNKALDKITIPASPILNKLGYGTGVSVMQLVRSPRTIEFRPPWAPWPYEMRLDNNFCYFDRVKAEADLLRRMSHPNIVRFGTYNRGKIVYLEACDLSLGDVIGKRFVALGEPFFPEQIFKVAADIASALDYLHTKMQILHGDVKSYNILVNGDFVICKLCDFGATLPLDADGVFDKKKAGKAVYCGTDRWRAPEVIHGGEISSKTDIWALGLTLWEMMALMPPHALVDDESDLSDTLDDVKTYFNNIHGKRPSVPMKLSEKQYAQPLALYYCCTETVAGMRPTAQHVSVAARDMLRQGETST